MDTKSVKFQKILPARVGDVLRLGLGFNRNPLDMLEIDNLTNNSKHVRSFGGTIQTEPIIINWTGKIVSIKYDNDITLIELEEIMKDKKEGKKND